MHALFQSSIPPDEDHLTVRGDEARHALRVKRLRAGQTLRLLDGKGQVATARIVGAGRDLDLEIVERIRIEPITPGVHVAAATPKGARIEQLIASLVQVGAERWSPMHTKLGVVDPREGKLSRMERIAIEALKQCGRPWEMALGEKTTLAQMLEGGARGAAVVLADASGDAYQPTGSDEIHLLIGPEGGWTQDEIEQARAGGASVVSFGPHAMRIEVAAPVAVGVILDLERRNRAET